VSGSREEKIKLAKKIWLALLIVLLINNTIAQTLLVLGQPPNPGSGPNPFAMYIPMLAPLGYLLSGVLFLLGIIAYRKDYSYAIVLISAAALVAALLNYSASQLVNGQQVLKVVPLTVQIIFGHTSMSGDTYIGFYGTDGQSSAPNVGTITIQSGSYEPYWLYINTYPPIPPQDVRILWYVAVS